MGNNTPCRGMESKTELPYPSARGDVLGGMKILPLPTPSGRLLFSTPHLCADASVEAKHQSQPMDVVCQGLEARGKPRCVRLQVPCCIPRLCAPAIIPAQCTDVMDCSILWHVGWILLVCERNADLEVVVLIQRCKPHVEASVAVTVMYKRATDTTPVTLTC